LALGDDSCKAGLQIRESVTQFELHFIWIGRLLYFSIGLVVLTTLLSGLVPALQSSRIARRGIGGMALGARIKLEAGLINVSRYVERWMVGQFALAFASVVSAFFVSL